MVEVAEVSGGVPAEDLIARAEQVLSSLSNAETRPFFIEFAGTPKSGKSTTIDAVAHFFRRTGFRVLAPTEGASRRTPFFLKGDLTAFNTWSACYALSQILEALHHAERYQIAILDRGLFDSLVWFRMLTDQGTIAEETCAIVQRFIMIEQWRSVIDLVVLFTANPETAMARENKGKLIEKHGRAMNPDFLRRMNEAYARVAEEYQDEFAQFLEVDTSDGTGLSERDGAAVVVDYALSCLERPPTSADA